MSKVTHVRTGRNGSANGPVILEWIWLHRKVNRSVELMGCHPISRSLFMQSLTELDRRTGMLPVPEGMTVEQVLSTACHFAVELLGPALSELERVKLVLRPGGAYLVPDLLELSPLPDGFRERGTVGRPRKDLEELSLEGRRKREQRERRSAQTGLNGTKRDNGDREPGGETPGRTKETGKQGVLAIGTKRDIESGQSRDKVGTKSGQTPGQNGYFVPPLTASRLSENVPSGKIGKNQNPHRTPVTAELGQTRDKPGTNANGTERNDPPLTPPSGGVCDSENPIGVTESIPITEKVLELLRGVGKQFIVNEDKRIISRFALVVEDLRGRGHGLNAWDNAARFIRSGGYSWRKEGPADLRYLCRPGIAAKLLEQARAWALEQRSSRAAKVVPLRPVEQVAARTLPPLGFKSRG